MSLHCASEVIKSSILLDISRVGFKSLLLGVGFNLFWVEELDTVFTHFVDSHVRDLTDSETAEELHLQN